MPTQITLSDEVAKRLQQQADARRLTANSLTHQLLDKALQLLEDEQWGTKNHRRVGLIHKASAEGLTAEEDAELAALQAELAKRLEPMDRKLLDNLRPLQEAVERMRRELSGAA